MSGRLPQTGQGGTCDPGEQTIDALNKIKNNLEEAGTSLENIFKWNLYVKDTNRDHGKIAGALKDYLRKNAPGLIENPPATTWVGVRELAFPSMLIEIGDIVAITPNQERIKTHPYFYGGRKEELFCSTKVVGNLVWASGMSGRLPETGQVGTSDPGQQTIDALNKIKNNLEEVGTSLENIFKWNLYVKDTNRDHDKIAGALKDYLRRNAPGLIENPPATTWVGVRELAFPSMLIEIGDIVAITSNLIPR
jgi:enamine deaminase RidA (YjgF/YER057c/UK114 family)